LPDDLGDVFEEFGSGAESDEAAVRRADGSRSWERIRHVAVFGVGDDEVALRVLAGADLRELLV
jgi:hypothetical protein